MKQAIMQFRTEFPDLDSRLKYEARLNEYRDEKGKLIFANNVDLGIIVVDPASAIAKAIRNAQQSVN